MKRLLLPSAAPGAARLEGPRFHHLVRVLRVQAGERLELFDGKGTAFPATVDRLDADAAQLTVGAGVPQPSAPPITIVQALPKADKLEWVLQKGTELGASRFVLAFSERCVVKPSGREGAKVQRWQTIADEAARQCGRADVPEVTAPVALTDAVRALPEGTRVLVLDEEETETSLSSAAAEPGPLALVVGPEGGLSRAEVKALRATSVTLGRRVLRTETAALAALAVLLHLRGELG